MLTLSATLRAQLARVQREVNRLPYRTDIDLYGQPEFWTIIDRVRGGDCEDFAIEKRRRLMVEGIPSDELRLATCWDETGEGHAVLTVDTDQGTLVLDNRRRSVVQFEALPYRWVSRQNGKEWVAIV